MADLEPTGSKIFDPDLGTERDAFPGEDQPEALKSGLKKFMEKEAEKYLQLAKIVKDAPGVTQNDINTLLRLGDVAAEKARMEYLETVKSNPVNILQRTFSKFAESNPAFTSVSNALEATVNNATKVVRLQKEADKIANSKERTTEDIVMANGTQLSLQGGGDYRGIMLTTWSIGKTGSEGDRLATEVLRDLGFLDQPQEVQDLIEAVKMSKNTPGGPNAYYLDGVNGFRNQGATLKVKSSNPGLNGVTVNVLNSIVPNGVGSVFRIEFRANPEALSRIIDKQVTTEFSR